MIFVTVGTHEQGFERLIKAVDQLVADGVITQEVVMQTGYTAYTPHHCQATAFIGYEQMQRYLQTADVVITHGGPATFMPVVSAGKVPIVVPRLQRYGEHVNDHQLEFVWKVAEQYNLIVLEQVNELPSALVQLQQQPLTHQVQSNRANFIQQLEEMIGELV